MQNNCCSAAQLSRKGYTRCDFVLVHTMYKTFHCFKTSLQRNVGATRRSAVVQTLQSVNLMIRTSENLIIRERKSQNTEVTELKSEGSKCDDPWNETKKKKTKIRNSKEADGSEIREKSGQKVDVKNQKEREREIEREVTRQKLKSRNQNSEEKRQK